jgi:predicted peptidase
MKTRSPQQARKLPARTYKTRPIEYLIALPDGHAQRETWPLLIFLHGSGERGNNLELVKAHGPPKRIESGQPLPFIVVSPQCPEGQPWDVFTLNALLDDLISKERVERSRVYLTGLSMGGYGTWEWAHRFPERFAAIAPVCGGGSLLDVRYRLQQMPIWAFHGKDDPVVPFEESERLVRGLRQQGNRRVKLTGYANTGHDSWTKTYANQRLYTWFLEHSR